VLEWDKMDLEKSKQIDAFQRSILQRSVTPNDSEPVTRYQEVGEI